MNSVFSASLSPSQTLSLLHSALKAFLPSKTLSSPLTVFRQLLRSNVKPNHLTFSLLIKASASSISNTLNPKLDANQIHTHLLKSGVNQFVYVETALLDLYMKLGCVAYARRLFDEMPIRDVVSWNVLICGYSRNECDFDAIKVFVEMVREDIRPDQTTLIGLVPSCRWYEFRKCIHGFGIKSGIDLDLQVKNALTNMYAKCEDLGAAEVLFGEMGEKCVVSWNTMISAYGQNGLFDEAMILFRQMREENVEITSVTLLSLLSANTDPESVHCYAIKTGNFGNASLVTSLVSAYSSCGKMKSAERLYNSLQEEDLVSLTAIISSYAEQGDMATVVELFTEMQQLDMKVDAVAMLSILHGIADPDHFNIGLASHGYAIKSGLCIDSLVANGLLSMYSKLNDFEAVYLLFFAMHEKSLISWNSVISGCVQAGRLTDAMEVFSQMQMSGYRADTITIASLLSGCSQLECLQFGERLHNYALRYNLEVRDYIGTALIDMYVKCGRIDRAEKVFKSIKQPCIATWNTMISGYSLCGFEQKALTCYSEMREQGLEPDTITFLGVLSACFHGGLVYEGKHYLQTMVEEFRMLPSLQHSALMVGLLGRACLFEEAVSYIKNMETEPDSAVWGALLGACCVHQKFKLGESVARKLYHLDYHDGGLYIMMSNLYATTRRWDDVARVRAMMKDIGGDGCSGVSLINVTRNLILVREEKDGKLMLTR